jgi:hypothetical protein
MRRLVLPVIAAFGLVMIGSSSAFADDPAPVVSAPSTPGKKVCKIADANLDEVSGIVATKTGFIVINDGSDDPAKKRIFFLDSKCKVADKVSYTGSGPGDTEDLILSPDSKTLWIADIGDNDYADEAKSRATVKLWTMPADGSAKPKFHRLAYPQGDHHDAEALLLNGDGTPLIVTKEVGKPAYIYQPSGQLQENNETPVPLERVGELAVSGTTTAGPPLARIGNKTIDGGAIIAGGSKVVLRTYTDALEWDVTNGDVLGALKKQPRTTGLPNEPQGEAITYSADGKTFNTASDMQGNEKAANYILQYTPATKVALAAKGTEADAGGKKWYDGLSIGDITLAVGGVGVLGLILVGVGVFGIVQHRKKVRDLPDSDSDDFANPLAGDPETELIGVGGAASQRAGMYGGAARSGPAYGPGGGGAPVGNGPVYGSGGRANGQQPGRSPQGAPPRGPQGQPARGPQGQPAHAPQGQPPRGPQGQPARAPQGQPARPPQGQPARAPQGQPARAPQGQPARSPQGQPARAPQGQPPRGPQGQPPRGPQGQPPRGPQGQPGRAPQGQPPRAPQGQPPRGPQGQPPRGPQGQPPRGGQGGGGGRGGQGRSPGAYGGQPPRGDGYSDYHPRREGNLDPGYGRR